ncbi:MAG: biopolymer transporter ExbD [Phycisphaerales bacterium]|nr:biopolymer transporter ExbD [Phycisphaerales bacterium]
MRIKLDDDEPVEVQMAPLIDCVFLLLIFFLVASTLKDSTRQLRLDLPSATAASASTGQSHLLVISIDRQGRIYLADQPVTSQELWKQIELKRERTPDLQVRIDADRLTPYHAVISVLSELQLRGVENVNLQTRNSGG